MIIQKIILRATSLAKMKTFYTETLGLSLRLDSSFSFSVLVGHSALQFLDDDSGANPFYHFAFNIPENQIAQAEAWLLERGIKPLKRDNNTTVYFEHWDAHAVFFRDPMGNIVELIARHALENSSGELFSSASLLGISEVGLPVPDPELAAKELGEQFGFETYNGTGDDFVALGNEQGLLLLVQEGRNWFPTDRPAEVHQLGIQIETEKKHVLTWKELPYKISGVKQTVTSS